MSTTYRPRPAPCTHCGDTVVIGQRVLSLFGARRTIATSVEHADPGPDGELFDGVDDLCRRPRVAG